MKYYYKFNIFNEKCTIYFDLFLVTWFKFYFDFFLKNKLIKGLVLFAALLYVDYIIAKRTSSCDYRRITTSIKEQFFKITNSYFLFSSQEQTN